LGSASQPFDRVDVKPGDRRDVLEGAAGGEGSADFGAEAVAPAGGVERSLPDLLQLRELIARHVFEHAFVDCRVRRPYDFALWASDWGGGRMKNLLIGLIVMAFRHDRAPRCASRLLPRSRGQPA
jgi:hypothetical protein